MALRRSGHYPVQTPNENKKKVWLQNELEHLASSEVTINNPGYSKFSTNFQNLIKNKGSQFLYCWKKGLFDYILMSESHFLKFFFVFIPLPLYESF